MATGRRPEREVRCNVKRKRRGLVAFARDGRKRCLELFHVAREKACPGRRIGAAAVDRVKDGLGIQVHRLKGTIRPLGARAIGKELVAHVPCRVGVALQGVRECHDMVPHAIKCRFHGRRGVHTEHNVSSLSSSHYFTPFCFPR